MKATEQGNDIFKVLEKVLSIWNLKSNKMSFKSEGEMKTLRKKEKLE